MHVSVSTVPVPYYQTPEQGIACTQHSDLITNYYNYLMETFFSIRVHCWILPVTETTKIKLNDSGALCATAY